MPHEFPVNTVLSTAETGGIKKTFAVCFAFPDDELALIERPDNYYGRRPTLVNAKDLRRQVNAKSLIIVSAFDDRRYVIDDDEIPKRYRQIRDHRYEVIKPFVADREILGRLLCGENYSYIIESQIAKHRVSRKSFYAFLYRFLAYGRVPNALLPHYHACGSKEESQQSDPAHEKADKKHAAKLEKKRGRPRKFLDLDTRNWTAEDTKHLKDFWEEVKRVAYKSDADLYHEFCLEKLNAVIAHDETRQHFRLVSTDQKLVSFTQFKYHFVKHIDRSDLLVRQKGRVAYANNHAASAGAARHGVRGPGDLYQIDATTSSTYLLWSKCATERISCGRPTLFVVVDVYTTMIVGLYVSLEPPNWEGAGEALFNAFIDKTAFCEEFGYTLHAGEWPCQGVPGRIGMDRDRIYSCNNLESLLMAPFGIEEIEQYTAYSGKSKGINERAIGYLESFNKKLPGAVHENNRIDEAHISNSALYTYRDYVKAVISAVIEHNNLSYKEHLLDKETVKLTRRASPLEIWNLTKDKYMGKRRQFGVDVMRFHLLSQALAVATDEGVLFKGRLYVNSACHGLFALTKNTNRDTVLIRHSRTSTNCIWWQSPDKDIYELTLSTKSNAYADAHEYEAEMLQAQLERDAAVADHNRSLGKMHGYQERMAAEHDMYANRRKLKSRQTAKPDDAVKAAKLDEAKEERRRNQDRLQSLLNGKQSEQAAAPTATPPNSVDPLTKRANKAWQERDK